MDYAEISFRRLGADSKGVERVVIARDVGRINLLDAADDLLFALGSPELGDGAIKSVRLVLKPAGHEVIQDGSRLCGLKVPSGVQNGIQIKANPELDVKRSAKYKLQILFDRHHSLVDRAKAGSCLLKPVFRLELSPVL